MVSEPKKHRAVKTPEAAHTVEKLNTLPPVQGGGYTFPVTSSSPAVPQGPANTPQNVTGPASAPTPENPMGTLLIATGPNPDGLRHQGLVAAQGSPGMDHLTTQAIADSRAPDPKSTPEK